MTPPAMTPPGTTGSGGAGRIGAAELAAYVAGSRLFATGAAESAFSLAADWAGSVIGDGVEVVAAGDLPQDVRCVAVSLVGSTTALGELLPSGDEPARAVRALEGRLGGRAGAVVALNLAAENALIPLVAAAALGVPLVDGDGTGRVFPLVEQTTFALGGVPATPLALAGASGEVVVIDTAADRVEELLRPVVLSVGGWAVTACYPMCAGVLARVLVPGTVSRLLRAGAPGTARAVAAPYGVRTLCRGRILAVEGSTGHGAELALPSLPSSIVVRESGGLGRLVRLEAHNEIVLALADGAAVAMAPDQICMIAADGGTVVDVDKAAPGMEVEIMVVRAAPVWHTGPGLALGGPRAFGLPL
ncbi:DUF917 domain-containing protein [Nonomuraea sp. ATR24]|uniref:DUF917 domain-containing protein n=1 Tax=Nonomuraea sp. ATR24 TaxID=1676744 RepID=UPI0035BFE7FA